MSRGKKNGEAGDLASISGIRKEGSIQQPGTSALEREGIGTEGERWCRRVPLLGGGEVW